MSDPRKRPRLLLAMPLPPPYSGPETYTQMLLASPLIERFRIVHFDTSSTTTNARRGQLRCRNTVVSLKATALLIRLLCKEKPDLALVFMPQNRLGFLKFAFLALPCVWSGVTVISSSQGGHFDKFYDVERPWMKRVIQYILHRVDGIIVLADSLKRQFEQFSVSERIWTVHLGLNTEMFERVSKSQRAESGMTVLYMGHLSKAKGALDLMKAVPLVLADYPDTHFMFAGDILKKERNITFIENPDDIEVVLHELVKRFGISEKVKLLGIVTGEAKLKAFVESDIFVLPSYAEGFPWVVLEAMLAGKAVIATPVGALPEVFEHGKHLLFVQAGDPRGISEAISRLISSPELRKDLGRTARELVQDQFNLYTFANQMETVCTSVLEGGNYREDYRLRC